MNSMAKLVVGDLVQMDPPRMKHLGKTIGVVVQVEAPDDKTVRVCWGEYGTFWTMRKLLKILTADGESGGRSSI